MDTDTRAGADDGSVISKINPFNMKYFPADVRIISRIGLWLFLVGLGVAALRVPRYWALSLLCSSSFMALGWAVGFLFGVPRTAADDTKSNTNLEQISDWLTKVLVGVGLTQLQKIPTKLALLAAYISKGYGPNGNDVFAISMVLYFSVVGFLTGYLLTRLALQEDFERDHDDSDVEVQAGRTHVKVDQAAKDEPDPALVHKIQVTTGTVDLKVDQPGVSQPGALTQAAHAVEPPKPDQLQILKHEAVPTPPSSVSDPKTEATSA